MWLRYQFISFFLAAYTAVNDEARPLFRPQVFLAAYTAVNTCSVGLSVR